MTVAAAASGPRLVDRRLLVTGASSGIGRAIATAAAEEGARLALVSRTEAELQDLADLLPGDHVVVPCDLRDLAAAAAAVDTAADALGRLDGVVNAAGVVRPANILEADPAGWQAMFEVNVLGLLAVTQAAVRRMGEHGQRDVVLLSSMSGRRRGSTPFSVYAATKHAVHCIGEGLAAECGPRGVRVLVVAPGFVATPIFRHDEHHTPDADHYDDVANDVGLQPEVVAAQVVHALAQPEDVQVVEIAMTSMEQSVH